MEGGVKFSPFDTPTRDCDFSLKDLGATLGLSDVQTSLLGHILRRIEIGIWYSDEPGPQLDLSVFLDLNHVASMKLNKMLSDVVEPRNDIGPKGEIEALEKLRLMIDDAITRRKTSAWPSGLVNSPEDPA